MILAGTPVRGSVDLAEEGGVRISDDVVAVIAALAAGEVEGVVGMSGGLVGGLSEMLGKSSLARGVKVEIGTHECAIDLYLTVEYGARIPVVAQRAQEGVKSAVERMTGLKVVEVNIHVQGLQSVGTEDTGKKRPLG
ncbi:MAG TPA: Asp23/Gls24 family envelope stress response protein [Bacillota bacterium]|nr:Asp23/Gls24 family envelope stress response protein [Bacillota bacterium]